MIERTDTGFFRLFRSQQAICLGGTPFHEGRAKAFVAQEHLDKLMEEYYVPEFAEDGRPISKELSESCEIAMGVIRTWT